MAHLVASFYSLSNEPASRYITLGVLAARTATCTLGCTATAHRTPCLGCGQCWEQGCASRRDPGLGPSGHSGRGLCWVIFGRAKASRCQTQAGERGPLQGSPPSRGFRLLCCHIPLPALLTPASSTPVSAAAPTWSHSTSLDLPGKRVF